VGKDFAHATEKFLAAIILDKPIVSEEWLVEAKLSTKLSGRNNNNNNKKSNND